MKNRNVVSALGVFVAAMILSTSAAAQLFRAYVESTGNDANPCNLSLPCRLLPAALSAIVDGGEVWMLDSANFNTGTVTIGKNASVLAIPGVVGSVVALGGPAISIAGPYRISLRNLVIVPFPGGGGTDGVSITGASKVTIEDSVIADLSPAGVHVNASFAEVRIVNSTLRNNSTSVLLEGGATAVIAQSRILGSSGQAGIWVSGTAGTTTSASVSDSVVSGHNNSGLYVCAPVATATSYLSVSRSTVSNNAFGIVSSYGCNSSSPGTTTVVISGNLVSGNSSSGLYQSGVATLKTQGNNTVELNSQNLTGSTTALGGM